MTYLFPRSVILIFPQSFNLSSLLTLLATQRDSWKSVSQYSCYVCLLFLSNVNFFHFPPLQDVNTYVTLWVYSRLVNYLRERKLNLDSKKLEMRGELQLVYSTLHLFKLHSAGCRRIRLRGYLWTSSRVGDWRLTGILDRGIFNSWRPPLTFLLLLFFSSIGNVFLLKCNIWCQSWLKSYSTEHEW